MGQNLRRSMGGAYAALAVVGISFMYSVFSHVFGAAVLSTPAILHPNGPVGMEALQRGSQIVARRDEVRIAKRNKKSVAQPLSEPVDQREITEVGTLKTQGTSITSPDSAVSSAAFSGSASKQLQTHDGAASQSFQASFAVPPWILKLAEAVAGAGMGLAALGVPGVPDVNICGKKPIIRELMLCIQNAMEDVRAIFETGKEVITLNMRVRSGGRMGDKALIRLKSLSSRPFAKLLMRATGTTMVCQFLMQRESTPDRQRWLAGSILSLITDIPVATELSDSKTGSFGHINVVLPRPSRIRRPDREIRLLKSGVDPHDLMSGDFLGAEMI